MFRIEHNVETGEIVTIELTAKEIAELEKEDAIRLAEEAKRDKAAEEVAVSKAAILDRLGITADEAKLLLA
jgi:hypothetical protein